MRALCINIVCEHNTHHIHPDDANRQSLNVRHQLRIDLAEPEKKTSLYIVAMKVSNHIGFEI
jgi:hypothetical protein